MIKNLLREAIESYNFLTEIDWEGDFSDVKKTCVNTEDVVTYLNKVIANAPKATADREKFDAKHPYVHSKSTFFKKGEEKVDIDFFIQKITTPPINIINTNEKILKTGGQNEYVYKTGIPAFRGIAYDIDKKQFIYINTCPGAGDCVFICYALKGRFIQYPASYDSMTRRLNYLLNYPAKYEAQLYDELKAKCKEHKALKGYKSKVLLRWNDSGDFFTKRYVAMADKTIKRLKEEGYNVDSYLYTKMADVAKTADFGVTSFSSGANKQQSGQIDPSSQKTADVIPTGLFKGLDLMKIADIETLKGRVAQSLKVSQNDVIDYDELMQTPESESPRWYVIVTPNDGDDAAKRRDVKRVLLTQH